MTETKLKNYPNVAQSVGIAGIVILVMLILSPLHGELSKWVGKESSMLVYYLFAMGIAFWIAFTIKKKNTNETSFNLAVKNKRIVPFVIVGTIALLFGIISPLAGLIPMPDSIKALFKDLASQTGISAFMLMVVAAPILEELIFRGIILDGLLKQYAPIKSILISSVLFGLVHLNPWQFIAGLIIGIFAGWVYYKTRSLSFCIIIHAAANLSGFIMRYSVDIESLMNETLVEAYGGLTNLILTIVASVIVISLCIYFLSKEFEKMGINIPAHHNA